MNLLKTLGAIAGIGGVSIWFMLYVIKLLLSKIKFSSLNQKQTFNTINRIIVFSFVITIIGLICYLISLIPVKNDPKSVEIKTEGANSPAIYSPNGDVEINISDDSFEKLIRDSLSSTEVK